ncbi:MAG TPA: hypothetical protein VFJ69_14660 [Actinomycetota bacterium]|nr:hypothetical protein [Actinomycetota bacterium]
MTRGTWELGWWAPVPPALEPDELIEPAVHGSLLAAVADGAPLDRLGQHRLESLKAAGLATADGRPRFPVAPAAQAKAVAETAGDLGRAMARLVAGEWSRLEVEYEPVHAAISGPTPDPGAMASPAPGANPAPGPGAAAFLVVGGLLLDLGVRRLLRRQGLAAPPFGSAFVWLAEGEGAAGRWFARVSGLPGRGSLIRFGRPGAPAFQLAAADPEAAPALPSSLEPALRELCEGLGWSVVRLVEDALPALDPVRRRVSGADDEGAFLAWAYTLAVDEAIDRLSARGLLTQPPAAVTAVRVTDPALAGAAL